MIGIGVERGREGAARGGVLADSGEELAALDLERDALFRIRGAIEPAPEDLRESQPVALRDQERLQPRHSVAVIPAWTKRHSSD